MSIESWNRKRDQPLSTKPTNVNCGWTLRHQRSIICGQKPAILIIKRLWWPTVMATNLQNPTCWCIQLLAFTIIYQLIAMAMIIVYSHHFTIIYHHLSNYLLIAFQPSNNMIQTPHLQRQVPLRCVCSASLGSIWAQPPCIGARRPLTVGLSWGACGPEWCDIVNVRRSRWFQKPMNS